MINFEAMAGFLAFPKMRRNTLALGLCVLAVLFALEAKTAWYGPANGPGSDVRSQKALPADSPASGISWRFYSSPSYIPTYSDLLSVCRGNRLV